ncbi:MAG TPA: FecR domain-containing protein [Rhizomicrobium sp.]|jgi:transmembrane sensor|nr:FecR domain-containing protein [Rhizomicrobium sp.]
MSAPAKNIETRASEWVIERQTAENWSAEDQARLDAWLEESLAHSIAYWRLNQCWDSTYRLSVLRSANRAEQSAAKPPRNWRTLIAVAAAFVAVAGLGAGAAFFTQHTSSYTAYDTETGGRKILTLADGSKIELNTQTQIRVAKGSHGREVWLDKGEAYFEIKHDAAHPFVVMAGAHRIVDLGTKFTVREEKNRIEVALLEGSAKVQTTGKEQKSEILTPGDVAVASADAIRVQKQSEQDLTDKLAWQRGVLVFRHVTLAEAAAEFNRYNRTQIVIADPKVAQLEIVGAFPTNDLALFARAAHRVLGVRAETQANSIVISR